METASICLTCAAAAVAVPVALAAAAAVAGTGRREAAVCGIKAGAAFAGLGLLAAAFLHSLGFAAPGTIPGFARAALFAVPLCVALNAAMLALRLTRTLSIDFAGMLKFAALAAIAGEACGSAAWGVAAALACFAASLALADLAAPALRAYHPGLEGFTIPDPFCLSAFPFAWAADAAARKIAGSRNASTMPEGRGNSVAVSCAVAFAAGCAARIAAGGSGARFAAEVFGCGAAAGAVPVLLPRVSALFMEALEPVGRAMRAKLSARFNNPDAFFLGVHPAAAAGRQGGVAAATAVAACIFALRLFFPDCTFVHPFAVFLAMPAIVAVTRGKPLRTFAAALSAAAVCGWLLPVRPAQRAEAAPAAEARAAGETAGGGTIADRADSLAESALAEAGEERLREELDAALVKYVNAKKIVSEGGAANGRARAIAAVADSLFIANRRAAACSMKTLRRAAEAEAGALREKEESASLRAAAAEDALAKMRVARGEAGSAAGAETCFAMSPLGAAATRFVARGGWFASGLAFLALAVLLYASWCETAGRARLFRRRQSKKPPEQKELF